MIRTSEVIVQTMARSDVVATVVGMLLFAVSFWFGFTSFERQYEFFSLSKNRKRAVFKTVSQKRFVCDATAITLFLLLRSLTKENAFYYNFYEDIIHAEDFSKGVNILLAHPVSVWPFIFRT